jgi:hypothetical protein
MSRTVALISREPDAALVRYLEGAGFVVHAYTTPKAAPREGTMVWLTEPGVDEQAVVAVRAWLGAKVGLRAILVAERPVRLREAADEPKGRVRVLPAPIFGWQLVDTLREQSGGDS